VLDEIFFGEVLGDVLDEVVGASSPALLNTDS
jgi:hypothetical protein